MKRALFLACVVFVSACDTSSPEPMGTFEQDDLLERAITLDGQRKLENFMLPASDDFSRIPQDPKNPLTPDKVLLGQLLFHDPILSQKAIHESGRGTFSCATCHHAKAGFGAGRQQSMGDGGTGWGTRGEARRKDPLYSMDEVDVLPLRSPSILNSAYQRVMLWSGAAGANGPNRDTQHAWADMGDSRKNYLGYDGVETQAILALNTHRLDQHHGSFIRANPTYSALWERVFPGEDVSDEKIGLAIAAYERTVLANSSPFQRWLNGETRAMSATEKRGAMVFFGNAKCADCHTGPALNSMAFYALGMPDMQGPDVLRPPQDSKGRGEFLTTTDNIYTFKVPQLYNLSDALFLGHGGTFSSVREVIDYYVAGIPARALPSGIVTHQFHPLTLTAQEVTDLSAFLSNALRDPNLMRYQPREVPSGGCIPANDPQSRIDLGCN